MAGASTGVIEWLETVANCDWIAIGKLTKMSHLTYFILLPQLIAMHAHSYTSYLCTVALLGLADWSAFLELVLPNM